MVLTATEKLKILATGKATLKEINELEKQAELDKPEDKPEDNPEDKHEDSDEVKELKAQLAAKEDELKKAQLAKQHEDISDKTDYGDSALSDIIKNIR